ncbi:MAG: hypothetical protein EOP48_15650 [Sphingobacteriales bacterium]|nr:MAG: hypothetical protein EOP48_15650 [Sphingobacteriales bacterium]
MKRKTLYFWLAWSFIIIGLAVTVTYLGILYSEGWNFLGSESVDIEKTGQFGDYVGGFVGTLFSLSGFIFLFLTLKEQREAVRKERFENHFFELLRLHRENVSEMRYRKFHGGELKISENRKVFRVIVKEFEECLVEVRHFLNSKDPNDYYIPKYKKKVEEILNLKNLTINLIDFATADMAYCIVFFGVGHEGNLLQRKVYQKKYKPEFYLHVLNYLRLKPKQEHSDAFHNWQALQNMSYNDFKPFVRNLYFADKPGHSITLSAEEMALQQNFSLDKYYGGHQHRLGHYFRHLFQTYKFLESQEFLDRREKYFYGKTMRSQLSTYEQIALFINSISSLGMRWELNPDIGDRSSLDRTEILAAFEKNKLITDYHLIKNLPGTHIYGLYFRKFYPEVNFEVDEYS